MSTGNGLGVLGVDEKSIEEKVKQKKALQWSPEEFITSFLSTLSLVPPADAPHTPWGSMDPWFRTAALHLY